MIHPGTIVEIVRPGGVYSNYSEMYALMSLIDPTRIRMTIIRKGDKAVVLASALHLSSKTPLVGIETEDGEQYVMNEDAVVILDTSQKETLNKKLSISELFEKKVMETRGFHEEDKVSYLSKTVQKGIIKSLDGDFAFVVYNCADGWDNFRDYTGVRTSLSDLKLGW